MKKNDQNHTPAPHRLPPLPLHQQNQLDQGLRPLIMRMILLPCRRRSKAEAKWIQENLVLLDKMQHPLFPAIKKLFQHLHQQAPLLNSLQELQAIAELFEPYPHSEDLQDSVTFEEYRKTSLFLKGLVHLQMEDVDEEGQHLTPLHRLLFLTNCEERMRSFEDEIFSLLEYFLQLAVQDTFPEDQEDKVQDALEQCSLILTETRSILQCGSASPNSHWDGLSAIDRILERIIAPSRQEIFNPFFLTLKRLLLSKFAGPMEVALDEWAQKLPYLTWHILRLNPLLLLLPHQLAAITDRLPFYRCDDMWMEYLDSQSGPFSDQLHAKIFKLHLLKRRFMTASPLQKAEWERKFLDHFFMSVVYLRGHENREECFYKSALGKIEGRLVRYYLQNVALYEDHEILSGEVARIFIYWERNPNDFSLNILLFLLSVQRGTKMLKQQLIHLKQTPALEGHSPQLTLLFLFRFFPQRKSDHSRLMELFFKGIPRFQFLQMVDLLFNDDGKLRPCLQSITLFYKFYVDKILAGGSSTGESTFLFHSAMNTHLQKKGLTEFITTLSLDSLELVLKKARSFHPKPHAGEIRQLLQAFQLGILHSLMRQNDSIPKLGVFFKEIDGAFLEENASEVIKNLKAHLKARFDLLHQNMEQKHLIEETLVFIDALEALGHPLESFHHYLQQMKAKLSWARLNIPFSRTSREKSNMQLDLWS